MSLSAHLTSGTAEHGRLRFRADCPRCRAERLAGSLGADALVSRRTQAALAAGVLALSATAPPAAALASEVDREQEGSRAPGGDQPGLEPDFDPGGDDTLDVDTAPVQGGPEAGGQEDDGQGAPVEAEPTEDPEARLLLEGGAAEPAPAQPVAPDPTSPPPSETPPPPAAELQQPPPPESPTTSTKRKAPKRAAKPRQRAPKFVSRSTPARAPVSAPVVGAAAPNPPVAAVPVSQPGEPPDPVTGPSYTVRPGDSLWSIARRLLGGSPSAGRVAREVNRLWELNQERIGTGNPSLVHVGIVLRLR